MADRSKANPESCPSCKSCQKILHFGLTQLPTESKPRQAAPTHANINWNRVGFFFAAFVAFCKKLGVPYGMRTARWPKIPHSGLNRSAPVTDLYGTCIFRSRTTKYRRNTGKYSQIQAPCEIQVNTTNPPETFRFANNRPRKALVAFGSSGCINKFQNAPQGRTESTSRPMRAPFADSASSVASCET